MQYTDLILFSLIFFIVTVLFFIALYTFYKLTITKKSIFSFLVITLELYLFTLGFITLFNLKEPIYIENLSKYFFIKYMAFLTLLGLAGISYYFYNIKNPHKIARILSRVLHPYAKEEVTYVINTIFYTKIYNIANIIIFKVRHNPIWKINFHIFIFFVYHGIRIIYIIVYIFFVFFHGDFAWCIYILPLIFINRVFNYLLYWFEAYIKVNTDKGKQIVSVTYKKTQNNPKVIYATEDDLELFLTPYGESLGYEPNQLSELTTQWLRLFHMSYLLSQYKSKMHFLDKILILIRLSCWIYFTYLLLYPNYV